jgi:ketosteroid isomerase-like protein
MRTATILFIAVLASTNLVAADETGSDGDKAAIEALQTTYIDGVVTQNIDKIMTIYARGTNLFVYDDGGPPYRSAEAYRKSWGQLYATYPGPTKDAISDQTIHVVGTIGYGHTIQTGEVTRKDGTKVKFVLRTTDIYRKMNGKWLIVEEHTSFPVDMETMKVDSSLSKP